MTGKRIVVPSGITADPGDQGYRFTQRQGWLQALCFCVGAQRLQFDAGKQHLGGQARRLAAQQRHRHNPPGNHQVDRNRPPYTPGVFMRDILNAESRL